MTKIQDIDSLVQWRCVGPFRGGRVVTVAGSYHDQNTFYFGAVAGGVWKTTDAGLYWRPVSDGFLNTSSVGALAVAPSDSNVIYAGTGETTIRIDVSHGDGVYKSTDAGVTWKHVGLKETRHIGRIRVHPTDPDTVWVAAFGHAFGTNPERGVYKTTDGGATWDLVLHVSDKAGAVDLSIDESNPRIIYATIWEAYRNFWQISSGGEDSGLWRSLDGGETWENITRNRGLPSGTLGKLAVAASPARTGRVWSLIEHTTEGGLYRSDDFGVTWEKTCDDQNLVSRAWYYVHVTADPVDPERVYVNNLDFYRSDDGGRTFIEIVTPHGDNHDLWIDPKNNLRMIQGNDGGANVSTDGGQTFSSIYNQPTSQFYHLGVSDETPYRIYGTQQDNSSLSVPAWTNSAAITWQHCYDAGTGESGYIVPKPGDPDIIYVGAIGSSPGGGNALQRYDRKTDQIRLITSWPESKTGLGASALRQRFAWTYPIVLSPHNVETIYIGGERVYRSTDEGQSWQPISPDLTRAVPETLEPSGGPVNKDAVGAEIYATIFSFIESPHEQGVFWAGSDDGLIHISRDGGENWTNVTPPEFLEWTMVSGIEPHPTDPATVYVAATRYKTDDFSPYLFVTRDYGQTWQRIDDGIPRDQFTRVIRCDPVQPGLLYVGTELGIHVSADDGASWAPLQVNLPVTPIHELIVKDTDLIAGTHGRSIWILDDLTPIRQMAAGVPASTTYLMPPRDTLRILPGIDWSGNSRHSTNYIGRTPGGYTATVDENGRTVRTYLDVGTNPPKGAIITYHLTATPEEPLTLSFAKADGTVVRTFTSRTADDKDPAAELRAPARPGWNRFVWDLMWAPTTKLDGSGESFEGPFVAPGRYTVTLKVGDETLTQELTVVKPENRPASQADLDAQEALLLKIHRQLDRTVGAINRMRDLRTQLDDRATRAEKQGGADDLVASVKALREQVLEIEKELNVPDLRGGWGDRNNAGARLLAQLSGVSPAIQLGDYRPTDAAAEITDELTAKIEDVITRFEALAGEQLATVNGTLGAAGLGAVTVLRAKATGDTADAADESDAPPAGPEGYETSPSPNGTHRYASV
ncbi:MAG TPA: glycosyl hydrolase [Thermomicrobiales bacterium]|jgi:photosystem II stability/assembly factor-like uncharacterized protein|nr:glycosyl hydrolase [Thermomicrobiales bacterium]